ncbi:MAG: putative DNA modification/repair radical SAM protein [Oscillospiraceae bacterium]|nr:putative DNA modification/repair radical SAM protein [Oscillospiraceae bacterium]
METKEKLRILADSAKYDAACTSSGSDRKNKPGGIGSASLAGCCHAFSSDGRCISLLKVLFTNHCINDCKYCLCRRSNDIERASFEPRELADLFINFYRRNYVEGLFLSSGIIKSPDYTAELLLEVLTILRKEYFFNGYIHVKAIPGAAPELINALGLLTDRMSVNIELPSEGSLKLLAPQKSREKVTKPMGQIRDGITQRKNEIKLFRHTPSFVPAGQSTQMIIGATPDSDFQIIRLSEALYKSYGLKRVFYSAYVPVGNHPILPKDIKPPLLREHRLYQADWLLRFYGFKAEEILSESNDHLDPLLDPKCFWAINHLENFPVEINSAPYEMLLRVPGIGVRSAQRIVTARRTANLRFEDLAKLRVQLKRAIYFITCNGKYMYSAFKMNYDFIYGSLTSSSSMLPRILEHQQLTMDDCFDSLLPSPEEKVKCLTGQF